eukprot:scaffold51687_cov20-Tisochrysis_lutea.AAC.2
MRHDTLSSVKLPASKRIGGDAQCLRPGSLTHSLAGQPFGLPAALQATIAPPGTPDYDYTQHTLSLLHPGSQTVRSTPAGADADNLDANQLMFPTAPTPGPTPPMPQAPSGRPSRARARLYTSQKHASDEHTPEKHFSKEHPLHSAPTIPQAPSSQPSHMRTWLHTSQQHTSSAHASDSTPPVPQAPSNRPSRVRAWLHAPEKRALDEHAPESIGHVSDELLSDSVPPPPQAPSGRPSRVRAHLQMSKRRAPEQQALGQIEPNNGPQMAPRPMAPVPATEATGPQVASVTAAQAQQISLQGPTGSQAASATAAPLLPPPPSGAHIAAGAAAAARPASALRAPPPLPHAPSTRPSHAHARLQAGKPERLVAFYTLLERPHTALEAEAAAGLQMAAEAATAHTAGNGTAVNGNAPTLGPHAHPPLPQAPSKRPSRTHARLAFNHSAASHSPVMHMRTHEGSEAEVVESCGEEVDGSLRPPRTVPTTGNAWQEGNKAEAAENSGWERSGWEPAGLEKSSHCR